MEKIKLTKRNFIKTQGVHVFGSDVDGTEVIVPCSNEEYAALATAKEGEWPTKEGSTYLYSVGGNIVVDSENGQLGINEYVEYEGSYLVLFIYKGRKAQKTVFLNDIVNDEIDKELLVP